MAIKKFFSKLEKIGEKISEDHLIKFDRKAILFIAVCFSLFALAVTFKLHGSSISMWDKTLKEDDTGFILGKPKSIRSDEWLVQTPTMLSQIQKNFPVENESLGAGKTPVIRDLPVHNFVSVFQLHNWGLFLLDTERGFSWFWNFKIFGMLVSFFLLLMLLTRNNFWLSLFGTLWLFFSSFIQWWFSINMSQMIVYFSLMVISFSYILFSLRKSSIIFSSVIFLLSSLGFIFLFYPPFQVVLAYLSLFLILGLIIKNRGMMKELWPWKLIAVVTVTLISVVLLYRFYLDAKDTIVMAISTAYPGNRVSEGAEVSLAQYFSGFFGYYLDQGKYPKNLGNVCEASNFILLFPLVMLGMGYNFLRKRKSDVLLWATMSYLVVLSVWIFVGFPQFLARLSLFSMVPGSRAILGLGIAGIIAVVLFLNDRDSYQGLKIKKRHFFTLFVILLAVFYSMNKDLDNFLRISKIIAASLVFTFIIYWLVNRRKFLFSFSLLAVVFLSTYDVNPLSSGLSPVTDKDLYKKVFEIKESDPDAKWIVFGDRKIADFIKSTGTEVVNGAKFPPDLKMMESLAGNRDNEYIYNRFAHIGFNASGNKEATFELKQNDYFMVSINPCSERIRDLGIRYFIFTDDPDQQYTSCLSEIAEVNKKKIFKYEENL